MLSFRASLACALSAVLFTSPAFARIHHGKRSARTEASASSQKSAQKSSAKTAKPSKSTKSAKSARAVSVSDTSDAAAGATGSRKRKSSRPTVRFHGQQGIDSTRATEIQQALIREHYLAGEPSGQWDSDTQAAMQKFQADQGWQTKLMPDSRALVKLGLGPDYSNAINAKTGNFAPPPPVNTIPASTVAGFAAGSRAATADSNTINR